MAKVVIEVEASYAANLQELTEFQAGVAKLVDESPSQPAYEDVDVEVTSQGITVSWEL